jgi:hypothetical protein
MTPDNPQIINTIKFYVTSSAESTSKPCSSSLILLHGSGFDDPETHPRPLN